MKMLLIILVLLFVYILGYGIWRYTRANVTVMIANIYVLEKHATNVFGPYPSDFEITFFTPCIYVEAVFMEGMPSKNFKINEMLPY